MKKCHFIGIGGSGMSGLAQIMLSKEIEVSGSDVCASAVTDDLQKKGAKFYLEHSFDHVSPDMTVVYSTDIKKDNPEYLAALDLKCHLMHRSELLQTLMGERKGLAVAGTHGKTTVSSLLTWVLHAAQLDPSFAIGGNLLNFQGNAKHGSGQYFVAEACESDGSFLQYNPYGAILTNVDYDHMDYYRSEEALREAFKKFTEKVSSKEHLFWCGDDVRTAQLSLPGIAYGFNSHCDLKGSNFRQEGWKIFFDAEYKGRKFLSIETALMGKHNAQNALAVFGMALTLGLDESVIREALRTFKGVSRRCEKKGEERGITFLDDYAHHPTEIKATLDAIRNAVQERRLIVIYQPHRYSRTKECQGMYGGVFDKADEVFVTEIYAAREKPLPGITHDLVADEIKLDLQTRCQTILRHQAADLLCGRLQPHDVVVTLGAGDVTDLGSEVINLLKKRPPRKITVGVIFGGASVEHEVSITSSKHIIASLRREFYEVEEFLISKEGVWGKKDGISKISASEMNRLQSCDIVFPVLHGPYGEDGTMQGFFEILGIPYVGCDHTSSAISMDKAMTKRLMQFNGIPTLPFVPFSAGDWSAKSEEIISQIQRDLVFPVFVKPVHLGSTIGISKVETVSKLAAAIQNAFRYDTNILVENGVTAREIEFSVLGNDRITVFPPGEICADGKIYSYEGKYSTNGTPTKARADLPEDIIQKGMDLVKRAYQAIGCKGMARVDTFLDSKGNFWLNEINPIPGFTSQSLYPQMCEVNGLSSQDLMDRLIILGLEVRRQKNKLKVV